MLLTVFTPTRNRAYILQRLYKSLCDLNDTDFEWLIVDDASYDNTQHAGYIGGCWAQALSNLIFGAMMTLLLLFSPKKPRHKNTSLQ